jgi:hypothetical protein
MTERSAAASSFARVAVENISVGIAPRGDNLYMGGFLSIGGKKSNGNRLEVDFE